MRAFTVFLLGALALPGYAQELPGGPSSAPEAGASSQPSESDSRERIDALISALGPVFKRCKTKRLRALMKSGSLDPSVFGLAVLLCGKPQRALRHLRESDLQLATYRAMAKVTGSGGLARARSVLAKASREKNAPAGALFLAALAFYDSGQPGQADTLLKRALKAAPSALDEAFAPDPGVGLARAARRALSKMGATPKDELRIATMLMRSGRRAEAHRWAKRGTTGADRARLLMRLYAKTQPRRALEHAERLSELRPKDREAAVTQVELLVHRREFERASARLADLPSGLGRGPQAAKLQRAKAAIALEEGAAAKALEAAERAARLQPRSDRAAALLARALLQSGELARAYAFAQELHRRRPIRIDPFGLMASIQEKRGLTRKVAALRLRSQGHREAKAKLGRAIQRRARVIEAVRSAESGLGVTGLDAVRSKDPMMSLTVDLALAKLGRAGTARAARDRILATCRRKLSKLLSNRRGWDRVMVSLSPYGKSQEVSGPLLAADPGRCGATLGFRRIKP